MTRPVSLTRGRRLARGRNLITVMITTMITTTSAQSSRDAYRDAFKAWRQGDSNLERDAATSTDLSSRTDADAAAAARFTTARAAYLRAAVAQNNASMQWLTSARLAPEPDLASAVDLQRLVAQSTEQVATQIKTYADDSDPALQPVRQALSRERSALVALSGAINDRQTAATKAAGALIIVEQARVRALEPFQAMAGALEGEASGMDQEALAWAEYYRKLAEETRAAVTSTAPTSTTPSPTTVGGVRINNPAGNANPAGNTAPRPNNPAVAPSTGNLGSRFVGSWAYQMGGLYHGPEPDVVNVVVKEEGGMLTGTVDARFWPFSDIRTVTSLHFEFSGTPGTGRVQSFPLVTADGAKGSIELIPGPAFNLLEINFYTDRVPGKMTYGNMLLLRN
jgi:hypothetical protein